MTGDQAEGPRGRGRATGRGDAGDPAAAPLRYVLRLYVTGNTPRSLRAVANTRAFCEGQLAGRYDLEVLDIYREPERARDAEIVAAPTLVREFPLPLRRIIGDMSERAKLSAVLGPWPAAGGPAVA